MKWILVLAASVALAQSPATQSPAPQEPATPPTPPAKAAPAADPHLSTADVMRASLDKQRASVEKQRAAVRKQAEAVGVWIRPGDPPQLVADCDPLADAEMAPLIEANAKEQEVKPELLRAVIEQESGYRPCAVSSKGAQGLMQLMPSTSQDLGVKDPFDPKENVSAGARFLKQLMDKYNGDLAKALGAYNAGTAAVDQAGGLPDIQETKDYVDAILKKLGGATRTAPPNIQTPKPIGN